MEQIYKANDGKIFNDKSECIAHEKSLKEKEDSRKVLHEKVEQAKASYDAKYKEAQDAFKIYQSVLSEFCNKYGFYHTKLTDGDLKPFDSFFDFGWPFR